MAPSSSLVGKLKVQLKLSISRLRMVQQKDSALAKQQRRAMAQLLEQGKEESAKIRVENIIRSDVTTELLEILELYCELLLARIGLLEPKECDAGLEEAVKSIIYAAPRTDVKELQTVRALLLEKYGKEFALAAMENGDGKVAERVVSKLKVEPPPQQLVMEYLKAIAATYNVPWPKNDAIEEERRPGTSDTDGSEDGRPPGGGLKERGSLEQPLTTEELSKATPPRDMGPRSPVSVVPPRPSTDNVSPKVKMPGLPDLQPNAKMKRVTPSSTQAKSNDGAAGGAGGAGVGGGGGGGGGKNAVGGKIPDVDELAKRFAELKR